MRISYTLKRAETPSEELRNAQRIIEKAKEDTKMRNPQKYIEQDIGTEPIPLEDLLYPELKI